MQKIIPHLWFDKEAKEAAEFHTSVFPNSKITNIRTITDTPSGNCDIVSFNIMGLAFQSISAGPYFKLNPSVSYMVNFDPSKNPEAKKALDEIWEKLIIGGKIMMPLGKYPFSEHYGWVEDKYGVSWQLILTNPNGEERSEIIPSIMFANAAAGKSEEATDYYLSVFKNSKRGTLARYPAGMEPDKEGTVMFTDFQIEGQWFASMDSAHNHSFGLNEATSFIVNCENQEEIDYFWEKLSAVPECEQCGWCKDQFGLSWQIVPTAMGKMMNQGTPEQINRVTQAFLKMKKFNIAELQKAYEGK